MMENVSAVVIILQEMGSDQNWKEAMFCDSCTFSENEMIE